MHNFTIITAEQRSPEWFQARLGRLTGSRAADMMATIKSGEAAARRNLRVQLVLERITNRQQERNFVSPAMQDGIDREADAYADYEARTGELLTRTGFLAHTTLAAGCSLDGHCGDFEGLIEIKSPTAPVHWDYLRSGKVPANYLHQIRHALWLTGAAWCDWMSYHPEFPEPLTAKLIRVYRTDVDLQDYDAKVRAFLAEVETELAVFRTMTDVGGVLAEALEARVG